MGHTETLVANKVDVLIIMKGGILMVSKVIKFVEEHKNELLVILTLGLTFNFSVSFSCNGEFIINIKTLVFVYAGYQVIKQITKVIAKKHTK